MHSENALQSEISQSRGASTDSGVGVTDDATVGRGVGSEVGGGVGEAVGLAVGAVVGAAVGCGVGQANMLHVIVSVVFHVTDMSTLRPTPCHASI